MISCAAACPRNASGAAPRSMGSTSLRCKILGRDGRATSALSPIATIKADVLHFAFVPSSALSICSNMCVPAVKRIWRWNIGSAIPAVADGSAVTRTPIPRDGSTFEG